MMAGFIFTFILLAVGSFFSAVFMHVFDVGGKRIHDVTTIQLAIGLFIVGWIIVGVGVLFEWLL